MKTDISTLPDSIQELKNIIAVLSQNNKLLLQKNQENAEIIQQHEKTIDFLSWRLAKAMSARFASKSEKFNHDKQLGLFDEAETTVPEDTTEIVEIDEEISTPDKTPKKRGRKRLPQVLPRVQHIHDLSETEKTCGCGCVLSKIGEEKSEQLEYLPARVQVIEHVRLKYACKTCEETIKLSPLPKQPIPKSIASSSLLAQILVSKYCDHLPLYRQEQILQRYDIDIARGTLAHWVIKCGQLLQPLVKLLADRIITYDVAYADETTVQVLKEPGRAPQAKSYLWLFNGGPPDQTCYVYCYHPTRSGDVPQTFFEDFRGFLHVDGYGGYTALGKTEHIQLVGCWAHARRYFADIIKSSQKQTGLANYAITEIKKLYAIEKQIREQASIMPEEIKQKREKLARPILERFNIWLNEKIVTALPKSPLGEAIRYCLNHWHNLMTYLQDGRLSIDNNRSERAIKPFVMGRKNWLFSDSVAGIEASTVIYSLIETAKAHQQEPYAYLHYVLTHIPNCDTLESLEKLLPFNLSKLDLPQ